MVMEDLGKRDKQFRNYLKKKRDYVEYCKGVFNNSLFNYYANCNMLINIGVQFSLEDSAYHDLNDV